MIKTYQGLLLENELKFLINQEEITTLIKMSMLRVDLCDYSNAHIVVKENITLKAARIIKEAKRLHLKIMHHLLTASQKLMMEKLIMQKT